MATTNEYRIIQMVLDGHQFTDRQFQSLWTLMTDEEKDMAIFVAVSEEMVRGA